MARKLMIGLCVVAAATLGARAQSGSVTLQWSEVADGAGYTVAGYRVYHSTGAVTNTSAQLDVVGRAMTTATVTGLGDCTTYNFAVKARTPGGLVSDAFSPVETGWPAIRINAIPMQTWVAGSSVMVELLGANIKPGALFMLWSAGHGRMVLATGVTQPTPCRSIKGTFAIPLDFPPGPALLEIENPDRVYGTFPGLATVGVEIAPPPPAALKRMDEKPE